MGKIIVLSKLCNNAEYINNVFRGQCYTSRSIDKVTLTSSALEGLVLNNNLWSDFSLQNTDITDCKFNDVHLEKWVFDGCWSNTITKELSANCCRFVNTYFDKVKFRGKTIISSCRFKDTIFSECLLDNVRFENCTFDNCVFDKCVFSVLKNNEYFDLVAEVEYNKCILKSVDFWECSFLNSKTTNKDNKYNTSLNYCTIENVSFYSCIVEGLNKSLLDKCLFKDSIGSSGLEEPKTITSREQENSINNYGSLYDDEDFEYENWWANYDSPLKQTQPKVLKCAYRFATKGI